MTCQWCIENKNTLNHRVAKPLSWVTANLTVLKLLRVCFSHWLKYILWRCQAWPVCQKSRVLDIRCPSPFIFPRMARFVGENSCQHLSIPYWACCICHKGLKSTSGCQLAMRMTWVQQGSGSTASHFFAFCCIICIYRCWQVVTSIHQASTGEALRNARERLPGTTSRPWCQKPPACQSHRCCHHHAKKPAGSIGS